MKKSFVKPNLRAIDVQACSLLNASGQSITGSNAVTFSGASEGMTNEQADARASMF